MRNVYFADYFVENADYSSVFFLFFKTNELTDFISFISCRALTLNCATLLLLALGIEVTAFLRSAKQKDVGSSPALDQKFFVQVFSGFVRLLTFFGTMRLTGNQKISKKWVFFNFFLTRVL